MSKKNSHEQSGSSISKVSGSGADNTGPRRRLLKRVATTTGVVAGSGLIPRRWVAARDPNRGDAGSRSVIATGRNRYDDFVYNKLVHD